MEFRQEMPPPGGYAPITYERVPLKTFFKPKLTMACILGFSGLSWMIFYKFQHKENNERIEMRCAKQAIAPMIEAETDRMILKQLKKNQKDEEKIMKDVKGWEVGKWNHSPVFLTIDPDEYFKPWFSEYYAHTDMKNLEKVVNVFKFT